MPRLVKDARLETRTARAKLDARGKPYWRALDPGLHIGYRKGATGGRWVARWYVGDERYKVASIDGIADDTQDPDGSTIRDYGAAVAAARALHAYKTARAAPAGPYSIKQAVEAYVAYLKAERRSADDTERRLNRLVVSLLGERPVADLTRDELETWKRGLIRTDKDDPDAERRSKDTANRVLSMFKAALNRAADARPEDIPSDMAWRKVKPFRDVGRAREVHLDREQARRLINACQGQFRELVTAGLLTGARYGELVLMRVRDFRADLRTLSVRDGKTGERDIVLTPEAVTFFEGITAGCEPDEWLFRRDDGEPWGYNHQIRAFKKAAARAKLPAGTVFYTLRHTYASQSILTGINLQLLAENMGTSIRMIEQHYGKFLAASRRELIEKSAFKLGLKRSNVTPLRARRQRAKGGATE